MLSLTILWGTRYHGVFPITLGCRPAPREHALIWAAGHPPDPSSMEPCLRQQFIPEAEIVLNSLQKTSI